MLGDRYPSYTLGICNPTWGFAWNYEQNARREFISINNSNWGEKEGMGGGTEYNLYDYIGSAVTNTIKSLAHAGSGLLRHIKASRPLSLAL